MYIKALRPKCSLQILIAKMVKEISFTTYIQNLGEVTPAGKLNLLVNPVDAALYELFAEASTYYEAIASL